MALTVHEIILKNGELSLHLEIADKQDYKLLQAVFRDCIKSRFGVEIPFGLTKGGRNKAEINYPCGIPMVIRYDSVSRDISLVYGGLGLSPSME